MATVDKILKLFGQLYPSGRAFRIVPGSEGETFHRAIGQGYADEYDQAAAILNAILPDNDFFTAADATDWERRLGIISNSNVSLADRILAIKRKMAHPGTIKARQHYKYLEAQLQAAGFNVWIHENRFALYPSGYETQNPYDIYGPTGWIYYQHGDGQHNDQQHGQYYPDIVVNHLDVNQDLHFAIGDNLRSTFFVGGQTLGTFADVDENRKLELRQLILRLKPAQTYGFLFINYI